MTKKTINQPDNLDEISKLLLIQMPTILINYYWLPK